MGEFSISSGGVDIAGDDAGEGVPVVLLHGLTATRRYVVMGSRALERGGHRVVAYDARGHGTSAPAGDPEEYGYDVLARDLLAVLDALGIERAVLAGASMGAHTSVRAALEAPGRVAGLVVATPAFDPERAADLDRWDRLSEGLRSGGVEGFVAAYGDPPVPERFKETVGRDPAPAPRRPRASRGGRRRPARACRAPRRSRRGSTSRRSTCRRPSSRAATRPTPSIRSRSGSATPRRSRALSS